MAYLIDKINLLEIARTGLYLGKSAKIYTIVGRRQGFNNTTVPHDLKEFDASNTFFQSLTGSETFEIVSGSANDVLGGTGIRQVKIVYIDDNDAIATHTADMNGGTPEAVSISAHEILWMESASSGSLRVAQGNIVLRIAGGGTEYEQITLNSSKSKTGKFMVPAGYTGYLIDWKTQALNNDQDTFILAQRDSETFALTTGYHVIDNSYIADNVPSPVMPLHFTPIPALARVKLSTISAGTPATVRCSGSFHILIIAD